jgi:hypothetical protein
MCGKNSQQGQLGVPLCFSRPDLSIILSRQEFSSVRIVSRYEFSSLQFTSMTIFVIIVHARMLKKGKIVKIEVTRIRTNDNNQRRENMPRKHGNTDSSVHEVFPAPYSSPDSMECGDRRMPPSFHPLPSPFFQRN